MTTPNGLEDAAPLGLSYEVRQTLGQLAYHAYGEIVGGRTHDGRPLPTWDELGDRIRGAWCHSAAVVHGTQIRRIGPDQPNGGIPVDATAWPTDR